MAKCILILKDLGCRFKGNTGVIGDKKCIRKVIMSWEDRQTDRIQHVRGEELGLKRQELRDPSLLKLSEEEGVHSMWF